MEFRRVLFRSLLVLLRSARGTGGELVSDPRSPLLYGSGGAAVLLAGPAPHQSGARAAKGGGEVRRGRPDGARGIDAPRRARATGPNFRSHGERHRDPRSEEHTSELQS